MEMHDALRRESAFAVLAAQGQGTAVESLYVKRRELWQEVRAETRPLCPVDHFLTRLYPANVEPLGSRIGGQGKQ